MIVFVCLFGRSCFGCMRYLLLRFGEPLKAQNAVDQVDRHYLYCTGLQIVYATGMYAFVLLFAIKMHVPYDDLHP